MKRGEPLLPGVGSGKGRPARPSLQSCPVCKDVRQAVSLGNNLASAMRRLKRRLTHCHKRCAIYHERNAFPGDDALSQGEGESLCPFLADFHSQLQAAINTVLDEWERG